MKVHRLTIKQLAVILGLDDQAEVDLRQMVVELESQLDHQGKSDLDTMFNWMVAEYLLSWDPRRRRRRFNHTAPVLVGMAVILLAAVSLIVWALAH